MLENLTKIKIENPSDIIIKQIRTLITSGELKAGDRLPSERKLADKFGVGRSVVRDALRKLEFYGIVKTQPQSGTVIEGIGMVALEGLITDVLQMEESNFSSLVETRILLEIDCSAKAAERRTKDDLIAIERALNDYEDKVSLGGNAVAEDLLFHLKIAEASKNTVLKSLMMIITPDVIKNYVNLDVCDSTKVRKTVFEHREILQFIKNQDVDGVKKSMSIHLEDVRLFSKSNKKL